MNKSKNIYLLKYSIGNHSAQHVYDHGELIAVGNATDMRKARTELRNDIRYEYKNMCTELTLKEYMDYEMAHYYFIDFTFGRDNVTFYNL